MLSIIVGIVKWRNARWQEQPPFMVVARDDDSLVFQFHKLQHHSHVLQTLTHSALLLLGSKE